MREINAKFSESSVSEFLIKAIESLSRDNFEYIKYLKTSNSLQTLDIIILLDKEKSIVEHLYSTINYRLSNNEKINTFFRSTDHESFMMPNGLNVHFCNIKKFNRLKDRWNIIAAVVDQKYYQVIKDIIKDIERVSFLVVLDENAYYSLDKEADSFWKENSTKRKEFDI
jgi:hypothetical protein